MKGFASEPNGIGCSALSQREASKAPVRPSTRRKETSLPVNSRCRIWAADWANNEFRATTFSVKPVSEGRVCAGVTAKTPITSNSPVLLTEAIGLLRPLVCDRLQHLVAGVVDHNLLR